MEMIELFQGENGKQIMIGFMIGAPAGYAFATRTALAVAREQIKELKAKLEKYEGILIKED